MIRTATTYDIPVLKGIWDDSFHDPINYIDFIFDRLAEPNDAIVYEDAGKIVSMLLMIKTKFVYKEESVDVVYIYGAATSKQYQNRGIMTYMLDYAENAARAEGAQISVLVPGEHYLINYYKKRGYNPDFKVRSMKLKPGVFELVEQPDEGIAVDRISPNFITSVRENALQDIPHISWDAERMKCVMEDSFVYGDHVAAYSGKFGNAYAFYAIHKKKLFIKECLGSTNEAQMVLLKEIIRSNRIRNATLTLPLRWPLFELEGDSIIYGMAKPLNVSSHLGDLNPYMNLMFD